MTLVVLSLGSNKGKRFQNLNGAVELISQIEKTRLLKKSSVYETLPFGFEEQENFLNAAVLVETKLMPIELLKRVKKIEKELGRQETFRWGPREIDIDILIFGNEVIETEELAIPHKHLTERDFFLVPLLEIFPDAIHPVTKKKLRDYLSLIDSKFILHKFAFEKNKFSGE